MKTINEITDEIIECLVINHGGDKEVANILQLWADSIVQECADICITDDAIQEDILKLKDQIQ